MVNLITCEFLKLKRSKMMLISILGAMVTPFMLLIAVLKERIRDPEYAATYTSIFEQTNLYIILLFGVIVYTVFASYLFSREYTEDTLKTILAVPVSKLSLLAAKYCTLLIWCTGLAVLSWAFSFVVGFVCGVTGLSSTVLTNSLAAVLTGTVLMVFALTPIIYLSIKMKGIVVPVICSAALVMFNAALSNEELAALFPWSSAYLIATGTVSKTGYSTALSVLILAAVSIVGAALVVWQFATDDVK